ncbi:Ig domain-containing protein [Aquabacterium sp.]|uniref:Ig domain-containing protein n=1 Tax=Aquabacterium sp. TaxID=1872578 RepID=UPI002C8A12A1|nr:Ig domain-containing protein [Aquabacterium sp.]HSW03755.1 Ig domain-containing protein [Aquabacterium sp.]
MKPSLTFLGALLLAGTAAADDSQPTVEKCDREMGSLAVAEPQSHVIAGLSRYQLGSPSIMLRMIAQESGCFAVVERGVAMQNLQQERSLAAGGQLQAGSNVGGGQMQVADFVMTPAVQFSDDTGGVGGVIGGLFGRAGGVLGHLGGLAGGVKFKEAETTLLVADVRSGIQVASAEGKASKMSFSLGGWGWGGLGWASGGGYSKTPEGKLIAASLLDNFNKIVQQIRSKPTLIRSTSQASQQNAAQSIQATGPGASPATAMPAVQTTAAPSAGPLPAALTGAFSGQYGGQEQGVFSVIIGSDGRISGIAQSTAGVSVTISGVANAGGALVMTGTGAVGASQFSGVIDANSGALVGTWRLNNGRGQGTFNGRKQ